MIDRYIVNVAAAVVDDEGGYLMAVRGAGEEHAACLLSLIGGKVGVNEPTKDVLEATLHREILEETGVGVHSDMTYVESKVFLGAEDGERVPVVDIVFLCRYRDGTAVVGDPDEVAEVRWMTTDEISEHPKTPIWTRQSIERCEGRRAAPAR